MRKHTMIITPIFIGMVLRCLWVLSEVHIPIYDEAIYHKLAVALVNGEEFGLQPWSPGWPLVLSVLYSIFGTNIAVGAWFNIVLSLLIILLVGAVSGQVFDQKTSVRAIWITSFFPSYIALTAVIGYEMWLQFLILAAFFLSLARSWTSKQSLLLAIITALATLVRPFWLILPCFLWLCTRWFYKHRNSFLQMVTAQVGAVLLIVPWIIYVSNEAGRFVPVAPNGGVNLWIGNNANASGTFMEPPGGLWVPINDAMARDEAIQYILNHPLHTIQLIGAKFWYLFSIEGYSASRYPLLNNTQIVMPASVITSVGLVMNASYWILSLIALVTVITLLLRRQYIYLMPLMLFLFNIVCYLPFFGSARYRWPLQFVLILYVAALPAVIRLRQQYRLSSRNARVYEVP